MARVKMVSLVFTGVCSSSVSGRSKTEGLKCPVHVLCLHCAHPSARLMHGCPVRLIALYLVCTRPAHRPGIRCACPTIALFMLCACPGCALCLPYACPSHVLAHASLDASGTNCHSVHKGSRGSKADSKRQTKDPKYQGALGERGGGGLWPLRWGYAWELHDRKAAYSRPPVMGPVASVRLQSVGRSPGLSSVG